MKKETNINLRNLIKLQREYEYYVPFISMTKKGVKVKYKGQVRYYYGNKAKELLESI